MTQQIRPLSPELTAALVGLGGRKLVLVEGIDDADVFEEWYVERLSDLLFFPAGGYTEVESRLIEMQTLRPDVIVFGIRDRDFHSDADVQNALINPVARLFLLRRYSIENYLLEPSALYREMQAFLGSLCPVHDIADVETYLFNLCQRMQTLMAANWVLIEHGKTKFPEGYTILERQEFITSVALQLNCSPEVAEQSISSKEALLLPKFVSLEEAQTCTSGKHLLHQVYNWIAQIRRGLLKDHLRRLLRNRIKESVGLSIDIVEIVETRILASL